MLVCLALSVVLPSYNEARRLPATLDATLAYLQQHRPAPLDWELIVVDDGSTDDTAAAVTSLGLSAQLRLLRTPRNRGKGAALAAGVLAARGAHVLLMDADGATPISALPRLEAARADVAVGARPSGGRPWRRELQARGFRLAARAALPAAGAPQDTQCGFKLLTRHAARECFSRLHLQRWAYDVELLYVALQLGLTVTSVPVPWADIPGSKIRWYTPLTMLVDVLRVAILYRCGIWSVDDHSNLAHQPTSGGEDEASFVEIFI
ncbi:hypothetical protein AB1Y20_011936 [Prymnesium parvum]|uniref:dolichyl-phosphate beta-glucosyltransferase n=1 Tax=Prymnesium parvum TaxID=97485 RepID=A0AB34IP33_PRYPA